MLVCAIDRRDGSVVLWRIYHEFLLSVYCYISLHNAIASTLWAWKIVDHESIEVITDSLSTFQRPEPCHKTPQVVISLNLLSRHRHA
jgi:hypothetical protein